MSLRRGSLACVSEHNPQSTLFIDYITNSVGCNAVLLSPCDDMECLGVDTLLVLLDADHVEVDMMMKWHEELSERKGVTVAALNMKDEQHAIEILSYMHLSGVFYKDDPLELLCKGIKRLMEGQLWMSRSLMATLIECFRRQSINSYRPACGLTQRELEIIGLLGTGASNIQIADRLFVSEHTVKSHLYNVFKKIDVHNRTQAVNWARQNLGAPPPSMVKRLHKGR
jgi:LuxR family transcriptional regulator of csgAB operon